MGVKNRTLDIDARIRRGISHRIDIDQAADIPPYVVAFDPEREIKVHYCYVTHVVDGNTGTGLAISVGVAGALTRYGTITTSAVAAANAVGTTEKITLTNGGTKVAKNVPLLVTCSATAGTNIGECQVVVGYEVMDRAA